MATLYAGTSGFAYPAWKPGFYPAKTPANQFLKHYAERLNCVEINYTFRRLPSASTLRELGGADARRLRLRGEGQHAHHAHPAPQERRRGHRALSENDRPAAQRAAPGTDPVPVAAGDEVRRRAAAHLPGTAARATCATPSNSAMRAGWSRKSTTRCAQRNVSLCVAESERLEVPQVITADFVYYRLRKPEYTAEDVAGIVDALQGNAGDRPRSLSDVQARREPRRRPQRRDGAEGNCLVA